jgi:hypothetical protein
MKKIFFTLSLSFLAASGFSQTQTSLTSGSSLSTVAKLTPLDKSPMDMAYFPSDYPMLKTQNKAAQAPLIRVIYSRPQRDNRVIFGGLVEYNQVWRMGANEATEIEFFKDAVIAGKKIAKGRYTLYALPTESKWTIIINKDTDTWGAFVYDQKKDVLRTDVPAQTISTPIDAFTINFIKSDKGASLVVAWDTVSVSLPIDIK